MIKIFRKEEGITLATLVITVILLIVITNILAFNSHTSLQLSNLTRLQNDIQALSDRIAAYYIENGELPIYKSERITKYQLIQTHEFDDISNGDGDDYYTIDLNELDNITLNYGEEYRLNSSDDKYIINEETHIVYYLRGVSYEGEKYHTIRIK